MKTLAAGTGVRETRQAAKGVPCEAIKGLIEEAEELLADSDAGAVRDAGLVACGQAVEHYEMARYGALIAWAQAGGHNRGEGAAGLRQRHRSITRQLGGSIEFAWPPAGVS